MVASRLLGARRLIALVQPVLSVRRAYQDRVLALSPFAYWPLNESAGPTLADLSGNTYNGTGSAGLTYGHDGPGAQNAAIYLDGNEYIQLPAAFGTAFPGSCGAQATLCFWGRVDSWDGANNKALTFLVNASNQIYISKDNTNNRTSAVYVAGAVAETVNELAQTSLLWRWYCMTWDKNAGADGEFKYYVDNAQVGTTQTALGVWAGTLPSAGRVLGAGDNVGTNGWLGYLSEMVMFDRVISAAERSVLYGV